MSAFLFDDMVEKPWVLVGESIVVLLPDMGGEQIVPARKYTPPWKLIADASATWRAG